MTNEDAIKYLQQLYPYGGHCWLDEQRTEAIGMAIQALQEKSISKVWHDVSEEPKPNMELICVGQYGNPLVLSSNSNSFKKRYISKWAYFNDLLNLSNVQRTVKDWKEPVSESLEKASTKYAQDKYMPVQTSQAFKAGAQWYKQQMMKNAVDSIVHCDKFGVILPKEDLKKAVDNLPELQVYDKVKLLIIKED